ncbi:hypothetical protein [Candidatus Poriferisodalis sp.]
MSTSICAPASLSAASKPWPGAAAGVPSRKTTTVAASIGRGGDVV